MQTLLVSTTSFKVASENNYYSSEQLHCKDEGKVSLELDVCSFSLFDTFPNKVKEHLNTGLSRRFATDFQVLPTLPGLLQGIQVTSR